MELGSTVILTEPPPLPYVPIIRERIAIHGLAASSTIYRVVSLIADYLHF